MFARSLLISLLILTTALFLASCGGGKKTDEGTDQASQTDEPKTAKDENMQAGVSELHDFHEVIFELWHNAYPAEDTAKMKELLPAVKEYTAILDEVELPRSLHGKTRQWELGVEQLKGTVAEYEKAAAADDEEALMVAVEQTHTDFEHLVQITRRSMEELDAFHEDLYQIYHNHLPDKNLEELRESSIQMAEKCVALASTNIPRWYKGDKKALAAGIQELCLHALFLEEEAQGENWDDIEAAVLRVHDQYLVVVDLLQ